MNSLILISPYKGSGFKPILSGQEIALESNSSIRIYAIRPVLSIVATALAIELIINPSNIYLKKYLFQKLHNTSNEAQHLRRKCAVHTLQLEVLCSIAEFLEPSQVAAFLPSKVRAV